jgi:NADPH-dependent glutamate synthase beta subunit-like oxidoreductase
LKPTDIAQPDYFHKVVDCQWACPAHTPVPEYIRLIAQGRYDDAYLINWKSNVFPGILGRTCDRPCEPACRRVRIEEGLARASQGEREARGRSRSAASSARPPTSRATSVRGCRSAQRRGNGKRIALVGGGPASLTVARDLAPLGYECVVFDGDPQAGGMMRTQIPKFRLPDRVIDEECGYILDLGIEFRGGQRIDSMKALLERRLRRGVRRQRRAARPRPRHPGPQGSGASTSTSASTGCRRSRSGTSPRSASASSCSGGGNTAMDCCRSSRRLGGEKVDVVVRSGYDEMKASPWEKEDAQHEGIPIHNFLVPKRFLHEGERPHRRRVRQGRGALRREGPPRARARPASPR